MKFQEGHIYHIYNRGNNRQRIFFRTDNYLLFIEKLKIELSPYCEILVYCLMPNHFHLMVRVKENALKDNLHSSKTLNNGIGILLRSYARLMQQQEHFVGSLFQQKTKAKDLADCKGITISYIQLCANYIHQNPIKSNLVKNLQDWTFSSYLDYIRIRNDNLCNRELFYSVAGIDENSFIEDCNLLSSDE